LPAGSLVHSAYFEQHALSDVTDAIVEELSAVANWLGLSQVVLPSRPVPYRSV
jgi:hypothetical protein